VASDPEEEAREQERQYEHIMPPDAPYEDGFNMKTIWAVFFVGLVMLPGAIYLGLVTGGNMAGASEWVTIILFLEIAKRSFVRLRTQELIVIYWVAGFLLSVGVKLGGGPHTYGGPFGGLIWDQYLIQSPAAEGLDKYMPDWFVPPLSSGVYAARTFVDTVWIKPVAILFLVTILSQVARLSLGYVTFRVTSDIEKLPFPMAPVQARGATALAETSSKQEGWRWRVFSTGTCIGMVWGLLYIVVPTLSGVFLTEKIEILPIPFIDFTGEIKSILPAAVFGIGTDLIHIFIGFVLPYYVVFGSAVGSIVGNLVINPVLYNVGVLQRWSPGMTAIPARVSNEFDFWLSFSIGLSLVIAFTGFLTAGRAMYKHRKESKEAGKEGNLTEELPEGRGDVSMVSALTAWVVATIGFVILCQILVPEFHWGWLAFFGFIYTPISSYIGARMIGLTGSPYGASIPYLRQAAIIFSGYEGISAWFAPLPIHDHGTAVRTYKQLELTKTKFVSYVKLTAVTTVVVFACSFLFWEFIWRLEPIPSSTYPYVQLLWPFDATMQTLWLKSTLPGDSSGGAVGVGLLKEIIKWELVVSGFLAGGAFYAVLVALKAPTLIFFGFVGSLSQFPHLILLQFIGALLGRHYFSKRFGEAKWKAYTPILLAGYSCGMGLIGMTSVSIALISKAVSSVAF
tara:strand:- start:16100 stop:18139 length:2040 start_codon:yes stop_codon:yes gene_type:complete